MGTNNTFLTKPEDYSEKPRYEVKTGESLHRRIDTYCVIQLMGLPSIKSHLLVVAHHPLGGGIDGWDSYNENLGIVESSKASEELLLEHADKYARQIAKKLNSTYFDLEKVAAILAEERKIKDAESQLASLMS